MSSASRRPRPSRVRAEPSPDSLDLFSLEKGPMSWYLRKWCYVLHNLPISDWSSPDSSRWSGKHRSPHPSLSLSLSRLQSTSYYSPSLSQRDISVQKSQFIIFGRSSSKISGVNVHVLRFKGI